MKIEQYDRVLLKNGSYASIVEIFDDGKAYLADIDKAGDTYTETVYSSPSNVFCLMKRFVADRGCILIPSQNTLM